MNRPQRKHAHLVEKISLKESISLKKPGKKTKRLRKWSKAYEGLAQGAAS